MTETHFIAFLWMLPAAILAPFVALAASTVALVLMTVFITIALIVLFLTAVRAALTFYNKTTGQKS